MADVGTIIEIEPEDGLGWIEMPGGERVRFGGTACKGFVPSVGMAVEVVGTRPGYGGTVKATELRKAKEGAAPGGAGAGPAPRQALHTVQQAGVRADDLLLALLGRADVDDTMHADLEAAHFEVQPQPGPAFGCPNPWLYVVALDGTGNAYGLYVHPMFEGQDLPWVFWNHEAATLRFVAGNTGELMPQVLGQALAGGADAAKIERLRQDLGKLGAPDTPPAAPEDDGLEVDWLPPDDAELRPLADYLAEADGGEMERGVLAYAFRKQDAEARQTLEQLYAGWGWSLPSWA